jgi:hypothetical protein
MINMRDAGAVILMLLFLAAPGWAAGNPEGYAMDHEHNFQQDIEGEGFAVVYQNVNTETLRLHNYMHGSGSIDMATLIHSEQGGSGEEMNDPVKRNISFVEQNEMTYAPHRFIYGTGYYRQNPIVYNSQLKEKTCGKNYQEPGVSMQHQVEYAQGFNKDIEVNLTCIEPVKKGPMTLKEGLTYAQMRIDEEVTEGVVHIGELITDDAHGWKKPLVEIDENYVGSFKIKKMMEVCAEKGEADDMPEDWLSCCFGGYGAMDKEDKMWGEEEIFDCSCREDAWKASGWDDLSMDQEHARVAAQDETTSGNTTADEDEMPPDM